MKKLLFFLFIMCVATTTYSQDMAITFSGLDNTTSATRILLQKATANGGNAYVIVKTADKNSTSLKEAATTHRVFAEVYLLRKLVNGNITTTKLTNVSLLAYSQNGQGSATSETFTLQFENEEQMH